MTLRFYRGKRHEATLRVTTENDYHLSWHYKAVAGISTLMEVLQNGLRKDKNIDAVVLIMLLGYYDEIRIS